MYNFYKFNFIAFAALIIALVSCVPLLSIGTKAKAETAKPSASSYCVPEGDAVDASLKASGLVNVCGMGSNFVYDQRYGTANNFTGKKIYNSVRIYLRAGTAQKLVEANREFNAMGYRIKIWDAYRPLSVQRILYSKAPSDKKYFIADPYTQSSCVHNKGAAVDITLVRLDGSSVEMPTDFDTFEYSADINNNTCSKQAAENRQMLRTVMQNHGFTGIECEWWHFNDNDAYKYSIIDVMF
jgi:zinc D-Ala-D-Ala dipeptidase